MASLGVVLRVNFLPMKKGSDRKKARLVIICLVAGAAVLAASITGCPPREKPDPAARWRQETAFEVGSLPRREWGASEDVKLTVALGTPRRITVHHSGGGVFSAIDRIAVGRAIRGIQDTHIAANGWDDIGYHFIIDSAGRAWEGRHLDRIGAHAGSRELNMGNIGILVLGNFDLQQPTSWQLQRLAGDESFFLSCRSVQRLFGLETHTQGMRRLGGLVRVGVLEVVKQGGPKTNKATRYRLWSHRFRGNNRVQTQT